MSHRRLLGIVRQQAIGLPLQSVQSRLSVVAKASAHQRWLEVAALKESMFLLVPKQLPSLAFPPLAFPPYSMSTFAIQDHMSKVVL